MTMTNLFHQGRVTSIDLKQPVASPGVVDAVPAPWMIVAFPIRLRDAARDGYLTGHGDVISEEVLRNQPLVESFACG